MKKKQRKIIQMEEGLASLQWCRFFEPRHAPEESAWRSFMKFYTDFVDPFWAIDDFFKIRLQTQDGIFDYVFCLPRNIA